MATTKPRIMLTLEPSERETFARLAALQHTSVAKLIMEMIRPAMPTLAHLADLLETAESLKNEPNEQAQATVADKLAIVQAQLAEMLGQADLFEDDEKQNPASGN